MYTWLMKVSTGRRIKLPPGISIAEDKKRLCAQVGRDKTAFELKFINPNDLMALPDRLKQCQDPQKMSECVINLIQTAKEYSWEGFKLSKPYSLIYHPVVTPEGTAQEHASTVLTSPEAGAAVLPSASAGAALAPSPDGRQKAAKRARPLSSGDTTNKRSTRAPLRALNLEYVKPLTIDVRADGDSVQITLAKDVLFIYPDQANKWRLKSCKLSRRRELDLKSIHCLLSTPFVRREIFTKWIQLERDWAARNFTRVGTFSAVGWRECIENCLINRIELIKRTMPFPDESRGLTPLSLQCGESLSMVVSEVDGGVQIDLSKNVLFAYTDQSTKWEKVFLSVKLPEWRATFFDSIQRKITQRPTQSEIFKEWIQIERDWAVKIPPGDGISNFIINLNSHFERYLKGLIEPALRVALRAAPVPAAMSAPIQAAAAAAASQIHCAIPVAGFRHPSAVLAPAPVTAGLPFAPMLAVPKTLPQAAPAAERIQQVPAAIDPATMPAPAVAAPSVSYAIPFAGLRHPSTVVACAPGAAGLSVVPAATAAAGIRQVPAAIDPVTRPPVMPPATAVAPVLGGQSPDDFDKQFDLMISQDLMSDGASRLDLSGENLPGTAIAGLQHALSQFDGAKAPVADPDLLDFYLENFYVSG